MENYPQPMQDAYKSSDEGCAEAEIVYDGGSREESSRYFGHKTHENGENTAVRRIKTMFMGFGGIMAVLGILLIIGGIALSATVIGIIFGLPMIIAGAVLLWLGITFIGGKR